MDNGRTRRRNDDHDQEEEEDVRGLNFAQNPATERTEEFSQSTLAVQPLSMSSRGPVPQDYGYGYGEAGQYYGHSIHPGTLSYQGSYSQDPQQQQHIQQYSQFGSSSGYGLPAQAGYPHYETGPQYQQRHSGSLGGIPSQFVAAPTFFGSGELGSASAPSNTLSTRPMPTQYPQMFYVQHQQQQLLVDRPYMGAPLYASEPPAQARPTVAMTPEAASQIASTQQGHAWRSYHTHLRQIFENIRDGKLSEAAQMLLELSKWLLTNVEGLRM